MSEKLSMNIRKMFLAGMIMILAVTFLSSCGKSASNEQSTQSGNDTEAEQSSQNENTAENSSEEQNSATTQVGQDKQSVNTAKEQEIIEDLVLYHGKYGADAADEEKRLLEELSEINEASAARWKKIMDYWKYTETELSVNSGQLPDGLPNDSSLCLVALDFQLNPDGTMKDELIERLKVVLNAAEKYPNSYIVCTGGGTALNDKDATEAGKMAEWLIDKGIPKERIIVEDKSLTTAQNAMFTYDLLEKDYPQVTDIAIISSDYHIATGALFFEAYFLIRSDDPEKPKMNVVSNAAYDAPGGKLSSMFRAGGLIELSGDTETAYDIYYETYDIHDLPQLDTQ